MRPTLLLLLWIASIGAFLPVTAKADATSDARKAIQAAYDRREAAYKRKDLRAYMSTFTPNYRVLSKSGTVYDIAFVRQQFERAVARNSDIQSLQIGMNILKITLKGKEADVTLKVHQAMRGKYRLSQSPYQATEDSLFEAIWIKTPRGWQEGRGRVLSRRYALSE